MFNFSGDLENFVLSVIPENAPEIQKREMKVAFTAGAKLAALRMNQKDKIDTERYVENIDEMFEYLTQEAK